MNANTSITNTETSITSIAEEIRREHENVIAGVRATVEAAIRCGQLLQQAKAQLPHGTWGKWLEENFPASWRTAQQYMQIADRAEDARRVAHLGVRGALKQIATAKPSEVAKPEDVEVTGELDGKPITRVRPGGELERALEAEDRDQEDDRRPDHPVDLDSDWHQKRLRKVEERFWRSVGGYTSALAEHGFRDTPANAPYYEAVLLRSTPEELRGLRRDITKARRKLLELRDDIDRALAAQEDGS